MVKRRTRAERRWQERSDVFKDGLVEMEIKWTTVIERRRGVRWRGGVQNRDSMFSLRFSTSEGRQARPLC